MKQLIVKIDDELHKQLKYLAIDNDKSIKDYVTELIRKDLEKGTKKE